jgi:hypothetical protein
MMTPPINKPALDTSPAGLQDPFGSKTAKTKKQKQQSTVPPHLTKKCDADAIMAGTTPNCTLHLTVSGPPSVQERARIRCQPVAGKPRVCDPSRKGKIAFRDASVDPRPKLRRFPGLQGQANLEAQRGVRPHLSGQGRRRSPQVCHGCPPGRPVLQ